MQRERRGRVERKETESERSDLRTTGDDKERIRQLHKREAPHVAQVDDVGGDAEQGGAEGKAVDQPQGELQRDDAVDGTAEHPLRDDGVLLDELRQIVQARGDGEDEEAEADEGSGVAHQR